MNYFQQVQIVLEYAGRDQQNNNNNKNNKKKKKPTK